MTLLMLKKYVKSIFSVFVPYTKIIWCVKNRGKPFIALTFDDGPDPFFTPKILKALRKHNAKATFFVIGKNAEKYQQLIQQIKDEGHDIGSHTYSHKNMSTITKHELKEELLRTDKYIEDSTHKIGLFRPPYGVIKWWYMPVVWAMNKTVVMWNVDSCDYSAKSIADIKDSLNKESLRKGDVVLLHEGYDATIEAIDYIAENAYREGIKLVTIREFIGAC